LKNKVSTGKRIAPHWGSGQPIFYLVESGDFWKVHDWGPVDGEIEFRTLLVFSSPFTAKGFIDRWEVADGKVEGIVREHAEFLAPRCAAAGIDFFIVDLGRSWEMPLIPIAELGTDRKSVV